MTCSSSVGLVIRCNITPRYSSSQFRRQTVCCHFDVGDMVGRTGDASPVSPAVATPLYVAELVWPLALNFVSDFTYLFLVVDFWTQASLIARQLGASVLVARYRD